MPDFAYKNPALPVSERVADLLSRMTLEEKAAQTDEYTGINYVTERDPVHKNIPDDDRAMLLLEKIREDMPHGAGCVHDIYSVPRVHNQFQKYAVEETRLGIPFIILCEALHGILRPGTTIFPQNITLAAAFDPELTERVGHAIAREARSLGVHETLGPVMDLGREPRWGRQEEAFGEDTCLSSRMAYAMVRGLQGDDISAEDSIAAEPKHFCGHGVPEGGLNCAPARMGRRELEVSHLPVFEAAIREAGAYNAMACYNSIDGEPVVSDRELLTGVLRERYGMRGFVRSDFGAIKRLVKSHRTAASDREAIRSAVEAGLDIQGFDYPNALWQKTLCELVRSGELGMDVLDTAVARILRVKFELGLFEHPYTDEERYRQVIRCPEHLDLSLEAAKKGLVLLKNDGLLPLRRDLRRVAVIGPNSDIVRFGDYNAKPRGFSPVTVLQAVRDMLPGAEIFHARGCGQLGTDLNTVSWMWYNNDGKIQGDYYDNPDFAGEPVLSRRDFEINFNWKHEKPDERLPARGFSVRWHGPFTPAEFDQIVTGSFEGTLIVRTDDSVRVRLDGVTVIDSFGENRQKQPAFDMTFEYGRSYDLEIEYSCDNGGAGIALCYDYAGDGMKQAVQALEQSEAGIVVMGDCRETCGESMDRSSLVLAGRQRELLKRLSETGKPITLVLVNGRALDLSWEAEHIPAILDAWFGGDRAGIAIAETLFGVYNPGGKLPVSFPHSVGHLPCYYSKLRGGEERYLDLPDRGTLFPFGHGLSYTSFGYSELTITPETGSAEDGFEVSFTVENTGRIAGDEVVQLYVRDCVSSVVTPDRELKRFRRITLQPGERQRISFTLDFDALKLLDRQFQWVCEPGEFDILVGSSSRDIRLQGKLAVK